MVELHGVSHFEHTFTRKVMLDARNGTSGSKQLTQVLTDDGLAETKTGQTQSVVLQKSADPRGAHSEMQKSS